MNDRLLKLLSLIALAGILFGLYLALIHAPTDQFQGQVQRLFYVHLGSFLGAFVGFTTTVIGSIVYLRTRALRWDRLAHAGVEIGLVLASINVLTGMIYARPIINSWWAWDPKLTSITIMVLTYLAYLMLRAGVENPERRRVFSSVYGILAFAAVIYTFLIIRVRSDTLHEAMFKPGMFALPETMQTALFANLLIWGVLVAPVLIAWRIRLACLIEHNERLYLETMR